MSRRTLAAALTTAALATLGLPAVAPAAGGSADSVWVTDVSGAPAGQLHYGDSFRAGFRTRTSQPWGFAECRPNSTTVLGSPNQGTYTMGDVMWSEYHSLYAGGPTPQAFRLIDPIQQLWLGGGATCKLSLLKFSGANRTSTVLATTTFQVAP